jgi:hypothetical protein
MSSSVDARIKHEAKLFTRELDAVYARRLERLRLLLKDEVGNMLARCRNAGPDAEKDPTEWLHQKTFDETYRDYSAKSKQFRTRKRFEALLEFCGNDKKLLLVEYTRALNIYFPIDTPYFEWAPRLVMTESGRLTMDHRWSRTRT